MNKKEQLFEKYAKDLHSTTKQYESKVLAVDVDSGEKQSLPHPCYLCPLCDKIFTESETLTLEHVPPGKLGGQKRLLVCKRCNNNQGSKLEKHLIDHIKNDYNNTSDITLYLENGTQPSIKCKLRVNLERDKIVILMDRKHMAAPYFNDQVSEANSRGEQIRYRFEAKVFSRYIELALLRIAYLKMFEVTGYEYYLSYSAKMIREQLANVDDKVMSVFYSDQQENLPEGIYDITDKESTKDYCGFLVATVLKTRSNKKQYSIILPRPEQKYMSLYTNLKDKSKSNFELTKLPDS